MPIILLGLDPQTVQSEQVARIRSLQPEMRLIITDQRDEMESHLPEIEIAAAHFPIPWISRAPALRWYQQWGAGTDWLMRHPDIAGRDFILTNASGVHAIPISEHILAFLLAFARRLPDAVRAQRQRLWQRDGSAFELANQTMLLIGVGAIGQRTAQLARALGMQVIGLRRNPGKGLPEIDRMVGPDQLLEVLPEADFVILTMPLTSETRNMLDERAFNRMKHSAYVVNIGRGGTIDQEALIEALRSGRIAGAGLDVFEKEPLPAESPLWEMENVIITPHTSGDTPHYDDRALQIFLDNLERFTNGQPMRNVVDKQRGY